MHAEAVIVDAVRTPAGKGKPGGSLSGVHPVDLLGQTLKALIEQTGIDPAVVDDVIIGCVSQVGGRSPHLAGWRGWRRVCHLRCQPPPSTGSVARASRRCTSPRRGSEAATTTL